MNFVFFDNRKKLVQSALNQDRGFLFGDGFFTTGVIQSGEFLHKEMHYQRLSDAAARLNFSNFDLPQLDQRVSESIQTVKVASIRITVSRQQQSRGYAFKPHAEHNLCLQLNKLPELPTDYCQLFFAETRASRNATLAGIKHLNRLDSVLAAAEISKPFQESLLSDGENIIGGSRSNLFALIDEQWRTPDLSVAGVWGITRQRIIQAMQQQQIPLLQTQISRSQLVHCQAAFITNSLLGIWPVAQIENRLLEAKLVEDLKSTLSFMR